MPFIFTSPFRIAHRLLACALALCVIADAGAAVDVIRKVAVTGELNSSGYSLYNVEAPAAFSNASQVTFEANGDFFAGGNGSYHPVLKLYDRAPGAGVFTYFYSGTLRQTKKGDCVFVATATYGNSTAYHYGIFLRLSGKIYPIAYEGGKAPGGGTFKDFSSLTYYPPHVSDSGAVAFFAETTGTGAPGTGLYFARIVNGVAVLKSVALINDAAGDGGTFTDIQVGLGNECWSINAAGEVAFLARTSVANYNQIFCWKDGVTVRIPSSENVYSFVLNNDGALAYQGQDNGHTAIRLATSDGQSSQVVVSSGDTMPDGNQIWYFGIDQRLAMNEAGEIAFGATTYLAPDFQNSGSGIYVWTPAGVRTVATSGPAPGGGLLTSLEDCLPILCNNGIVYFVDTVAPAYEERLFKHDKTALTAILSVGDILAGDTVAEIFLDNLAPETANQQPLNDRGELAFRVRFETSFKYGLFTVTPPPFPPEITVPPTAVAALVGQRFSYAIQASNFPTVYSAVLDGSTKLPPGWTLNAAGLLTGIPTAAGTYTIDLHAANAGGSGDAQLTITVADISGYKGAFSGLAAGAAHDASDTGVINVTVGAKPTYTAGGTFAGTAFSAGGPIRPDGQIVFETKTGQTIRLQLDLTQPHLSIPGIIEDASTPPKVIATFAVDATPTLNPLQSPSAFIGPYTFILPPDAALPMGAVYPAAAGVGTIKVAGTGGVTLTTYLADGSLPFIAKGTLTTDGKFRFALPKRAGTFLAGDFALEQGAGDSVTGSVTWQAAGQSAASHIVVQGSRYHPPTGSSSILAGPLSFRFTGGGITDPDPQSVTLTSAADRPPNIIQFTPGSTLKSVVVVTPKGMLTGTFGASGPALSKPGTFTFRGVFLQKQNRAEGFFKGPNGAGSVTLQQ